MQPMDLTKIKSFYFGKYFANNRDMKLWFFVLCLLIIGVISVKAQNKAMSNLMRGREFLADNAKRTGVKTTSSGLQYEVIKDGDGPSPKAKDTVTVHYRGTTISGEEFDSSYKRGQPTSFPVNRVIAGWTEALQLMKVGAKWKVYIPANLAYGAEGAGSAIGPNETLIFEIELIGIK